MSELKTANEILLEARGLLHEEEDLAQIEKQHAENQAKLKAATKAAKLAKAALSKVGDPPHLKTFKSKSERKKYVTKYNKAAKAAKAAESEYSNARSAESKSAKSQRVARRSATKAQKVAAKSPAAKSPAAKSPAAKSPAAKSPAAKSRVTKKPGEKTYKVGGKEGVWRSGDSGQKIFIPNDGSPPKGNRHVTGESKTSSRTANEILQEKRRLGPRTRTNNRDV